MMGLLKYINKKMTFGSQCSYLSSYFFFGMPIGYGIGEGIRVLIDGQKYHFNFSNFIFGIIINLLIITPFLVNYFIQMKKFKFIINKHLADKNKKLKVKAIMDYSTIYEKGKSYEIEIVQKRSKQSLFQRILRNPNYTITVFYEDTSFIWQSRSTLLGIINKFELDDIKEERRKKLARLKKL